MNKCNYCLCWLCTRRACPLGKWHCWGTKCNTGPFLDCLWFTRRKVTKVYHIKRKSPVISAEHLQKLRDSINTILGDYPEPEPQEDHRTMHAKIQAEELRHRAELRKIVREAQEKQK